MPTPSPTIAPSPTPAPTMIVRAYFLMGNATGDDPTLVPVLRTVPETSATLRAAFEALIAGPTAKERGANPKLMTMIPAGTELRSVKVSRGVATIDLTGAFLSGTDPYSIEARISQVIYTLTQFPTVTRVHFLVDGKDTPTDPPTVWRLVAEPMGRGPLRDLLMAPIFVDRPAWGASYLSGTEITGLANVPEAQFLVALRDASGAVLDQEAVTASCGTGCWGTFSVKLHYEVAKAQWGTLRVWDISEADSTVIDLRTYPVYLRP